MTDTSQPDRRLTFREIKQAASNFWRRMPVTLVAAWLALSVGLYLCVMWQGRAIPPTLVDWISGDLQITSARQFIVIALLAQAVSLLRTGLFLPARLAYDGRRLSLREVFSQAAARAPALFLLQFQVGALIAVVALLCFALGVQISLWALLPLGFALEPAKYYVTAHEMSGVDAIWRSLEVTRRHWLPIFVIFSASAWLSAALPGLVDAAIIHAPGEGWSLVERIGRISAHVGADFVTFIATCGLYFALDERE